MADLTFGTEEYFANLATQGLTVVYRETAENQSPGQGWELWSTRRDGENNILAYCWRKVVTLEEAAQFDMPQ